MTTTSPVGVPARTPGHSALHRLIGVDDGAFAHERWGQRPLFSRRDELPGGFEDLFTSDAVDELLSCRGLRTPFLRMAKGGSTLPERTFTSGGGIGAGIADQVRDDSVLRLLADGSTIVLQGLHRNWPPLIAFSQQLAAELGHAVQVNAYVTPPQNTGFSDHYDVHDVFVVQISGEKHWRIRPPVHESPLRDQPWTAHRAAVEEAAAREPLLDFTIRPNECLYLPRGYLHSATALGGVSVHLTIGVHTWTRHTIAEELVSDALSRLAANPVVRESLPLGLDVTEETAIAADTELVRAALHRAIDRVDVSTLKAALTERLRGAQRSAPLGPLGQLEAAAELDGIPVLTLRPHLVAQLEEQDGYAVLHSRAGQLRLARAEVPAVRALLKAGRAEVHQLGAELARRLLLGAVVVPDSASRSPVGPASS